MMERKTLKIFDSGDLYDAELIYDENEDHPFIQLVSSRFNSDRIESNSLFFCLMKLHEIMDAIGLKLLCNGFRYDVFPSRMSLSMGSGIMAYLLVMGHPAVDLVNIFDETDRLDLIGTVEEQKKYYNDWIEAYNRNRT